MTQNSSPWDGILTGDAANAPYSAAEWSRLWALLHGVGSFFPNYGVLLGTGDGTYEPLQVIAAGGSSVEVKVGAGLINGKLYETDAAVALTVAANASGNPRIDTVVLRVDYTAQTVRPVIKQGTPAASPARPSLTQNSTTWETPLADISVANGFASITQANIADRRRYAGSAASGWMPYAYPLGTDPSDPHASSFSVLANDAIAIPFALAGNLLLDQLSVLTYTTVSAVVTWGVYIEDLNDGNGTAKSVRRIGGRTDIVNTISFVNTSQTAVPADKPIPLAPGMYWLLFKPEQNLSLGAVATTAGRFNHSKNNFMYNTAPGTLGQTVDISVATGGYTRQTGYDTLAIRFDGRILDETAAF